MADIKRIPGTEPISFIFDFYLIAHLTFFNATFKYGQKEYDFDNGVLSFMAPNQVFGLEFNSAEASRSSGWLIMIHPDFLFNTPLEKTIHRYKFFDYSLSEALNISEKEELILTGVIENIEQEYHSNIDKFSQEIIVSHIEVLLNYSQRFYQRQFITRNVANHKILERIEEVLSNYFDTGDLSKKGLITVQYISDELNISPNYLSELLKTLTGQSTQQHIHDKLIFKAKELLSTTNKSVSEISFELGFEHLPSFSKLFKAKTALSPLEFRQSFN